ncbi:MAG: hypothetical protein MZV63_24315 [Marinilabiliales bacterium]|nr:hypothetical protein [Marinilabiliales bacterium]
MSATPLETIEWHNTSFGLKADYQLINDLYLWGSFTKSNISGEKEWTPDYFYGNKNTFNLGNDIRILTR